MPAYKCASKCTFMCSLHVCVCVFYDHCSVGSAVDFCVPHTGLSQCGYDCKPPEYIPSHPHFCHCTTSSGWHTPGIICGEQV